MKVSSLKVSSMKVSSESDEGFIDEGFIDEGFIDEGFIRSDEGFIRSGRGAPRANYGVLESQNSIGFIRFCDIAALHVIYSEKPNAFLMILRPFSVLSSKMIDFPLVL